MKKFILILCFITFYSFSQGIELPKINNVEELMKAEKPAVVKVEKEQIFNTPITSVTSNNYNSIIFTLIFIVLLIILLKLIYK